VAKTKIALTEEGKRELAVALVLWKDFKDQGKMDIEVMKSVVKFAEIIDVTAEFQEMLSKMPRTKIILRE
jgi:hypothetical protein